MDQPLPTLSGAAQAAGQPSSPDPKDVQENKDIAALGYIWALSIFVYLSKRHSPFVRFHARQGVVLFLLSIPVWFIPILGRFLELIILALAVMGFLAAAQGQWKELPLIGAISRRDKHGVRQSWRDIATASTQSVTEAKDLYQRELSRYRAAQGKPDSPQPPTPPAPPAPPSPPAA